MIFGPFEWFVLGLAGVVLLWGFNRYRTRFVKADLIISIGFAFGILLFVFMPSVYDELGNFFDIQQRVVFLTVAANVVLLLSVLYLITKVRETGTRLDELNRRLTVEQATYSDGGREEIAVVIPAYNEEDTIASVIESLPDSIRGYEVEPIVVSDGSIDETATRARINGSIVVNHHINQGQGGALKTGFEIAREKNASIVVTMDADGQHPAEELERLVQPVIDDEADYVMGSRYLGTDYSNNGPIRRAGIWTFTKLINLLTRSSITDFSNGFRAIRGSEIDRFDLREEQFSAPELIIEARKNDLRLQEVPIRVNERQSGETKKPQLGYALGLTRTIFSTWIR